MVNRLPYKQLLRTYYLFVLHIALRSKHSIFKMNMILLYTPYLYLLIHIFAMEIIVYSSMFITLALLYTPKRIICSFKDILYQKYWITKELCLNEHNSFVI